MQLQNNDIQHLKQRMYKKYLQPQQSANQQLRIATDTSLTNLDAGDFAAHFTVKNQLIGSMSNKERANGYSQTQLILKPEFAPPTTLKEHLYSKEQREHRGTASSVNFSEFKKRYTQSLVANQKLNQQNSIYNSTKKDLVSNNITDGKFQTEIALSAPTAHSRTLTVTSILSAAQQQISNLAEKVNSNNTNQNTYFNRLQGSNLKRTVKSEQKLTESRFLSSERNIQSITYDRDKIVKEYSDKYMELLQQSEILQKQIQTRDKLLALIIQQIYLQDKQQTFDATIFLQNLHISLSTQESQLLRTFSDNLKQSKEQIQTLYQFKIEETEKFSTNQLQKNKNHQRQIQKMNSLEIGANGKSLSTEMSSRNSRMIRQLMMSQHYQKHHQSSQSLTRKGNSFSPFVGAQTQVSLHSSTERDNQGREQLLQYSGIGGELTPAAKRVQVNSDYLLDELLEQISAQKTEITSSETQLQSKAKKIERVISNVDGTQNMIVLERSKEEDEQKQQDQFLLQEQLNNLKKRYINFFKKLGEQNLRHKK